MVFAYFYYLIIILLSIVGLFFSGQIPLMLICGGVLMVIVTYEAMLDPGAGRTEEGGQGPDKERLLLFILKAVVTTGFAVFSGNWTGFILFAVLGGQGLLLSPAIGTLLFLVSELSGLTALMSKQGAGASGRDLYQTIAYGILVGGVVFLSILLLQGGRRLIRRKLDLEEEKKRRIESINVSEMHERQMNRELVKQNYLADRNARLLERENISRNIHNSVGHSITAAIMTLDAADMLYDVKPEEARKRMNDANERIRGSLESIRRAVRTLDDEASATSFADLRATMEGIIDEFVTDTRRVAGEDKGREEPGSFERIEVRSIYDIPEGFFADEDAGGRSLTREHAEFLTGALEEFLTNGLKHGGATRFIVHLSGDSAHIRLSVRDNGKSDFGEENREARIRNGFGVKKIISYAERCGGRAEFNNDDGFSSSVELPIG